MRAIVLGLAFCLVCSAVIRAPMALLYVVVFPLLCGLAWLLLVAVSPSLAVAVILVGFMVSLTAFLQSRR